MRKITLANLMASIGIAVLTLVILASAYSASVFIWMQNEVVVKYDGYELKTTFWNLIPHWLTTGEAGNSLSIGCGMVAGVIILSLILRAAVLKIVQVVRGRVDEPVTISSDGS